jgi:hypothetical protein
VEALRKKENPQADGEGAEEQNPAEKQAIPAAGQNSRLTQSLGEQWNVPES